MLKKRIITAAILLPVVIGIIYLLPPVGFLWFTCICILLAAWEWSHLMGAQKTWARLVYVAFILVMVLLTLWGVHVGKLQAVHLVVAGCVWWAICTVLILLSVQLNQLPKFKILQLVVIGLLVLLPAWIALNVIRSMDYGSTKVLFLMLIIWLADTCAYFAGKHFGGKKLAPIVSPKKTWSGVLGAVTTTVLIAFALQFIWPMKWLWLFTLVVVIFSIIGDLFESLVKRQSGVKDSGSILPGHGGFLDRIDSLTAAAPVYALGLLIMTGSIHSW